MQLHINILTTVCIEKLTSRLHLSPLEGQPLTIKLGGALLHRFPIARAVIVADCGKDDLSLQCRLPVKPESQKNDQFTIFRECFIKDT